jgi:hypothetical protein
MLCHGGIINNNATMGYVMFVPLLLETPENAPRRPVSDKYSVGLRWSNKTHVCSGASKTHIST